MNEEYIMTRTVITLYFVGNRKKRWLIFDENLGLGMCNGVGCVHLSTMIMFNPCFPVE